MARLGLALAALAALSAAAPSRAPTRVVSLNPCLDAILLEVADRGQVAALSHYARDPRASGLAAKASGIAVTYESAEEVTALRPDLVLTSVHAEASTTAALARLGTDVQVFDIPTTVQGSLSDVRRVAALVGHPDRGEALVRRIEAALDRARPAPGDPRPTALILQPNGFAAGRGTLPDEMLSRTGFVNVADRYGVRSWGVVSLESLLADPPQVLLSGRSAADGGGWAERLLAHPALAETRGRLMPADFPERLLYCGGPTLVEAANALSAARRLWRARGR